MDAITILSCFGITCALMIFASAIELYNGRDPYYKPTGPKLWNGDIKSPENSKQLLDPYSFTHIEHGVLFYWLSHWLIASGNPVSCFLLVVIIECVWEVIENTHFIIQRYRYDGDTLLNSMGDIMCCISGYFLACYILDGVGCAIFVVVTETVLFAWIRDNLILSWLIIL